MEPIKEVVVKEEAIVNKRVQEADVIKAECEKELSKVLPIKRRAEKDLKTLTDQDINLLKHMRKPPLHVRLVMEAVCIINSISPARIQDPKNPMKKILSYWDSSLKFLSDSHFLEKLVKLDINKVPPKNMERIRKEYIS